MPFARFMCGASACTTCDRINKAEIMKWLTTEVFAMITSQMTWSSL